MAVYNARAFHSRRCLGKPTLFIVIEGVQAACSCNVVDFLRAGRCSLKVVHSIIEHDVESAPPKKPRQMAALAAVPLM